jgi:3-deoxy-D-manno-octulosonic-acid transferase
MRHVCVPDDVQRSRYIELGVPEERVVVTGHTKYDVECVLPSPDERIALRQRFFPGIGADEKIIALGSVRPGEENAWFQSIVEARGRGERVRLIVAPRHAEKFDYFWEKIQQLQIPATRWSFAEGTRASGSDILLLDAYGVLEQAYAASDLAFIGATLVDIGGHNPMEAAMFGTPLCVGPYTSVIEQVLEDLTREGGVLRLAGASDVSALVERLCAGDGAITLSGARARQAWQRHRGATDRVLSILQGT